MPLQQADFRGVAGHDGWLGRDWVRFAAAGQSGTRHYHECQQNAYERRLCQRVMRQRKSTLGPCPNFGEYLISPENLKVLRNFSIPSAKSEWFSGTFRFPPQNLKVLRNFSLSSGRSESSPELFAFLRKI